VKEGESKEEKPEFGKVSGRFFGESVVLQSVDADLAPAVKEYPDHEAEQRQREQCEPA